MNNNIKVSVIIPVYNSEKYIGRCIDSVINQTYSNYEIIIINDGSKDNSEEIIKEYEKNYPDKIRYEYQQNQGVAKTRNKAIKMAEGEYITFLDNDDFIDTDYIENLVSNSNNGNYDVVLSGYRRPNENGKALKEIKLKDTEWSKLMVLAPWAKIFKKSYIMENNIEYLNNDIGEDLYFNLQALLISDKLKIVDYVGYNWFYNTESVSNTKQKDIRNVHVDKLLNDTYNVLKEKQIIDKHYDLIEMHYIKTVLWALLYATKKVPYAVIKEYYDKLFLWLEERFPNYRKTKMIGLGKPKGEVLSVQLYYLIFMILHKMNLGKLVIYLYSRL